MADIEVQRLAKTDQTVLHAIFHPQDPFPTESEHISENTVNTEIVQQIPENVKKLEVDAVKLAQDGNLIDSLDLLNKIIMDFPSYASGYNNRAQLFRIQGDNVSAYDDLNKAITLSNGRGNVASQAYVQRGLLHKLNSENEEALKDFESATKLGNVFAKSQVKSMNPYAALCNQMLGEAFSKLYNGDSDMV